MKHDVTFGQYLYVIIPRGLCFYIIVNYLTGIQLEQKLILD